MILVTLGTNPYPFARLIKELVEWRERTGEHVIVQSGNTPIVTSKMEVYPFLEYTRIIEYMREAEVVITHGGFGSLRDCMTVGAKTVAVPRLIDMNESQDDQVEIVKALAEENLVIPLYDVAKLDDAVKTAKNMELAITASDRLPQHIAVTIRSILNKQI